MKIAIASDHAGYAAKELLKSHLHSLGHECQDCGAFSEEPSDYPDFASKAAKMVSKGSTDRAVLICGSGIGMCIAANRLPRVRAAVIKDERDAKISRQHNDVNVACFGSRALDINTIKKLTDIFLSTPFEGGRHLKRVNKIDNN